MWFEMIKAGYEDREKLDSINKNLTMTYVKYVVNYLIKEI